VYEHVLGLPPEYREPLLLRCLRGMSYRQIGEVLDLPVTTIETRLARARRMIRSELDEVLAEDIEDASP
jgi:RNA polymerase sigma-70 factor (ECF subfamily)